MLFRGELEKYLKFYKKNIAIECSRTLQIFMKGTQKNATRVIISNALKLIWDEHLSSVFLSDFHHGETHSAQFLVSEWNEDTKDPLRF